MKVFTLFLFLILGHSSAWAWKDPHKEEQAPLNQEVAIPALKPSQNSTNPFERTTLDQLDLIGSFLDKGGLELRLINKETKKRIDQRLQTEYALKYGNPIQNIPLRAPRRDLIQDVRTRAPEHDLIQNPRLPAPGGDLIQNALIPAPGGNLAQVAEIPAPTRADVRKKLAEWLLEAEQNEQNLREAYDILKPSVDFDTWRARFLTFIARHGRPGTIPSFLNRVKKSVNLTNKKIEHLEKFLATYKSLVESKKKVDLILEQEPAGFKEVKEAYDQAKEAESTCYDCFDCSLEHMDKTTEFFCGPGCEVCCCCCCGIPCCLGISTVGAVLGTKCATVDCGCIVGKGIYYKIKNRQIVSEYEKFKDFTDPLNAANLDKDAKSRECKRSRNELSATRLPDLIGCRNALLSDEFVGDWVDILVTSLKAPAEPLKNALNIDPPQAESHIH